MADATTTKATTGKVVGATTKGAATGAGIAGAAATLIMYILAKTGLEQDPAVAGVLAGALVTLLSGVGALIGGKLSPTNQGDALYAQQAVDAVDQMVSRLAAAQAVGPEQYAPSAGEQPVTAPVETPVPAEAPETTTATADAESDATEFADGSVLRATGEPGAGVAAYEGEHVITSADEARAALQGRYNG